MKKQQPLEDFSIAIKWNQKLDQKVYNALIVDKVAAILIEDNNLKVASDREIIVMPI